MKKGVRPVGAAGAVLFLAVCLCVVALARAENFQKAPIVLRASEVLPKELLSGPNYTVREMAKSDGFINVYEIESQYGHLRIESTELLRKRIAELNALAKIGELEGTSVYVEAFKATAAAPVKTAVGVVTDPIGTTKGIATGVGNFFGKIGSSVKSKDPDKDSVLKSVLGQASYKRQFAYEFGVDPYTTFEPLQKALNDVAWTSAAGGLTVKAAFMAIPGAAGAVIGYSGTAESMRNLVRDKTPPELQEINKAALYHMDIVDPLANTFLMGTSYTPQEKTFLVGALARMKGVAQRGIFIEQAAMDCEEAVALFMRVRAELMAKYFEKMGSVDRFVSAAGAPLLLTKDGRVVGVFPLDYVAWTVGFSQKAIEISSAIDQMHGIKDKEFWITGTMDPVARKALEARGWRVEDRIMDRLLK
jgi:hypothetical protein